MANGIIILFLFLAALFAAAHAFAIAASLYWYYWWFDVVMHFWGGALTAMGAYILSTFSWANFELTTRRLLFILLFVTVSWEVFEWVAGLWQPATYLVDTTQDIALGFGGGLAAYFWLQRYTMKQL